MTRRTRRRVYAVALSALVGASAPLWAPPLLSRMDLFRVEEVGVVGARYLPPDEVVERADVQHGASVWDDPGPWEERVLRHPLVRRAEVRRAGFHRLEIRVREVEPVALAATPELVPVDRGGRVLPLDPAESALDLPLVSGRSEVEGGRLADPEARRLVEVLARLRDAEPGFVAQVSEVEAVAAGVRLQLTDSRAAQRVLLPADGAVEALRRVEMALGNRTGRAPVEAADARFAGQVVLRTGDARAGGERRTAMGGAP